MAGIERIKVAVKSDDVVLRDPVSKERLTTEGKRVPKNSFWLRRLKAGDCIQLPETSTKIEHSLNEGEDDGNFVQ